jgi:hypothetical protein
MSKNNIKIETVNLSFICPKTEKRVSIKISDLSVNSWEEECDMCGSHGKVEIIIQVCPLCKKSHSVEIKSW